MDWFRTCDEVPEEYQRVGIGLCFGGQSKLFLLYIISIKTLLVMDGSYISSMSVDSKV